MFNTLKFSDKKILDSIKSENTKEVNIVLSNLYQTYFETVKSFLLKKGAKEDEVADIFQDSLIVFIENARANKFQGKSSIKTYLIGIAKNLWFHELERNKKLSYQEETQLKNGSYSPSPLEKNLEEEGLTAMMSLVNRLSEDCQWTLKAAYYENYSMAQIKEYFNLGSEQAAKNKKYRCLQHLIKLFKQFNYSIR